MEWNHHEKQIRGKKLLEEINDSFFFRQLRILELVWVKLSVNDNIQTDDEHVAVFML